MRPAFIYLVELLNCLIPIGGMFGHRMKQTSNNSFDKSLLLRFLSKIVGRCRPIDSER